MPYATYRFNKIIAAETIRFIVTVAIVVYKGLKLVVYRMLTEYIYSHVCDYNLNRLNIEINTENILRRQDEILSKINELKHPITIIPPNINGLFIRGHHIKLRYVVAIVAIILMWAVAASVSSLQYKEGSFAHYSMYRAVKEQYQNLIEKVGIRLNMDTE